MLWLTALVAMGVSWWLDARGRDYAIKSAQLRKDYYNLMSDLARSEIQKAKAEVGLKEKQLAETLRRERDRAGRNEKAAALESEANR